MTRADEEAVRATLLTEDGPVAFNRYIGIEFLELDHRRSRGRIKLQTGVTNPYGFMHGGVLLAFADTIAGNAACMCGYYCTTVNSNLNFLRPADDTEYVYCEAELLRSGRHVVVYDVRLYNDREEVLDSGEFSYFRSKNRVLDKLPGEKSEN